MTDITTIIELEQEINRQIGRLHEDESRNTGYVTVKAELLKTFCNTEEMNELQQKLSHANADAYHYQDCHDEAKSCINTLCDALIAMIEEYDAEGEVLPAYYQAKAAIRLARAQ